MGPDTSGHVAAPVGVEPVVLVVNSRARTGAAGLEAACEALARRGVPVAHAVAVGHSRAFRSTLAGLRKSGARIVAVGGGDGTISSAAHVLAGSDTTLAVLPLGTANDFARNLGLPSDLEGACDAIARGRIETVDLGWVEGAGLRRSRRPGRFFVNAVTVGLSARITDLLSEDLKRHAGRLAYPAAAVRAIFRCRPFRLRMRIDGHALDTEAFQVVIGNGRYHGAGSMTGPHAGVQDRLLDVYAVCADPIGFPNDLAPGLRRSRQLLGLGRVASLLKVGGQVDHATVAHQRAREVVLETDPPQDVDADGERVGAGRLSVRVVPDILRVVVPPGFRDAAEAS